MEKQFMAKKTFAQEIKEMTPEEQKDLIEKLFLDLEKASNGSALYDTEASRQGFISATSQKIFRVARLLYGLDENGYETEGVKECRRRAYVYLPHYRKLSDEEKVERDIAGFIHSEAMEAYETHLSYLRRMHVKKAKGTTD